MNREPSSTDPDNCDDSAGACDAPDADSSRVSLWKNTPTLREAYPVRSYEVDACGRLSISALCNFMQDAAGMHAEELGVSVAQLQKQNKTWMLSRLVLQMNAYPGRQDRLHVTTWPSGIRRLFALRDFLFRDDRNRPLGSAATAWLIIDMPTRRPLRVDPFVKHMNPGAQGDQSDPELNLFEKIPESSTYENELRFRIRYRDLDINRHVNNVSFIEWVVESLPTNVMHRSMLSGLEINFLAEAFHGDIVISKSHPLEDRSGMFLHSVVREADGQELVRARTVWQTMQKDPLGSLLK
ncbi:MAG: acyl-ACP thioesterase domain-containing protein [Thermodesulfobacteriota bacterium]